MFASMLLVAVALAVASIYIVLLGNFNKNPRSTVLGDLHYNWVLHLLYLSMLVAVLHRIAILLAKQREWRARE